MSKTAEARAATIEQAVESALRAVGLRRDQVDVAVLDPGRRGLLSGRKAHVRVTELSDVPAPDAPAAAAGSPPPHTNDPEDPEEDPVSDTETTTEHQADKPEEELTEEEFMELLDRDADLAADFIEGLLDLLDLPGDIEIVTEEQQALVTVQDVGSGLLIGRRGATLDALQELVRCAIQRQTERRTHVRVDVEGYRSRQLEKLRDKCREVIAEVRESEESAQLEPMDAYERKMMHDLVAKSGGVTSSSEGNEPRRRVVIHPAD
jgi:spoIIIJ-associated protein